MNKRVPIPSGAISRKADYALVSDRIGYRRTLMKGGTAMDRDHHRQAWHAHCNSENVQAERRATSGPQALSTGRRYSQLGDDRSHAESILECLAITGRSKLEIFTFQTDPLPP